VVSGCYDTLGATGRHGWFLLGLLLLVKRLLETFKEAGVCSTMLPMESTGSTVPTSFFLHGEKGFCFMSRGIVTKCCILIL
jgi:hypothetical protein